MNNFVLEVLTPDKTLYWGRAEALTAKALDGEVKILSGHAPYVTILSAGDIRLHNEDNLCLHFKHTGGMLEVTHEKVSVLIYPPTKD